MNKYRLKKDLFGFLKGEEKTIPEWVAAVPFMWGKDFHKHSGWFEEIKEEPQRIGITVAYWNKSAYGGHYEQTFTTTKPITQEKFPAILTAIEEVLNPDPAWAFEKIKELTLKYQEMTDMLNQKKYTTKDMEECWGAARLFAWVQSPTCFRWTIPSFQDYLQSLNK